MGYKYELARDEKPDYDAEIPKAREEFKAYRVLLAKKREKQNGNGQKKGS